MKKIVLFLFFISGLSFPQEKYLIYFKDKDIKPGQHLSKASPVYQGALKYLTGKCLQRRMRVLNEDSLVTFDDLPVRNDYKSILNKSGIEIARELKWFNAVSARLNNDQLNLVKSLEFVDRVEKVKIISIRNKPQFSDTAAELFSEKTLSDTASYGYSFSQLEISDIPIVHSRGIQGEGVIIGLLDSGFDWKNHRALRSSTVLKEYDFVFGDAVTANEAEDVPDQDGHGTFVFSIIGGYDPGNYLGAAYKSSFILAKTENVKIESSIEEDNYANALEWMENQGVDITCSSVGYNEFDNSQSSYRYSDLDGKTTITVKAAEKAFQRGVVVISTAGNEGNNLWHHILTPADGRNVIAVGALNQNKNVAPFSGRGPSADGRIKPDVVALGVGVYGAQARSKIEYGSGNGTSYSTPVAGGAAALLMSAYPHLRNYQVRSILLESAGSSSAPNNDRGYGLVSAKRSVEFPNLEYNGVNYLIHKAMLEPGKIQPNSMNLFFKTGLGEYNRVVMKQSREGFYQAELPGHETGSEIKFYFEYRDPAGNIMRDSYDNNYRVLYGSLTIYQNITPAPNGTTPDDFVLSQNYPNPFNNLTRIGYRASAGERAELIIMNAIGQTVRYFSRISEEGLNSVIWDGRKGDGSFCASGVYYYILRLSGKDYGKKMVLLR